MPEDIRIYDSFASFDAIAIQNDGKIVVGGFFSNIDRFSSPGLFRISDSQYSQYMIFNYDTTEGDISPDLDYLNRNALVLNG
jgi:hypothetical protein